MKQMKYVFSDESLLELALTQSGADADNNNERLEFLGDRVLGLAVADMLYGMFPDESEGELARRHAMLVSTKTLAVVAREFGFDRRVRHGHMTGGRMEHIAANAMESIIAAIFLDGGWIPARDFIRAEWTPHARAHAVAPKDPKTELQEMCQHSAGGELPRYEFIGGSNGLFDVRVSALGKTAAGSGATKKAASVAAAAKLLRKVKK